MIETSPPGLGNEIQVLSASFIKFVHRSEEVNAPCDNPNALQGFPYNLALINKLTTFQNLSQLQVAKQEYTT